MKTSEEFVVGKHNIGYVDPLFTKEFGEMEITKMSAPTFQKLSRSMTDADIESELKPGLCTISDTLAFMDSAPKECKDGWANIFYTPAFVVSVGWLSFGEVWRVYAWFRIDIEWSGGLRVFSPAIVDPSNTPTSALGLSETLNLEKAIEIVKAEGYRIFKEV